MVTKETGPALAQTEVKCKSVLNYNVASLQRKREDLEKEMKVPEALQNRSVLL